jgi:hypothetical protein
LVRFGDLAVEGPVRLLTRSRPAVQGGHGVPENTCVPACSLARAARMAGARLIAHGIPRGAVWT